MTTRPLTIHVMDDDYAAAEALAAGEGVAVEVMGALIFQRGVKASETAVDTHKRKSAKQVQLLRDALNAQIRMNER